MIQKSHNLSLDERVELGAKDGVYFGHEFFPRTFRQSSPEFHYEMFAASESLAHRFVGFKVFRDGAKTTILRTMTAKRISYALTNVGVYSSAAQRHAERSVRWLKRQVEVNRYWTETFGLRKGSKWSDSEIEIVNEMFGTSIYVLAIGMTGQTRGVNIDDWRPDWWVWDDIDNEETAGSEEQRKKQTELFFGAMANTIAPLTENEHAKGLIAQTPLAKGDIIDQCADDPTWNIVTYGILDERNRSRWESRYPTEEVLKRKAHETSRGRLHIWMREKECKIVPSEGQAFQVDRIVFYDWTPTNLITYIGIDPAREKVRNQKKAHKSAIVKIGVNPEGVFLLDYYAQKGKNPEELWAEFYRMATSDYPRMTGVEGIAYQQILAWYFRQKMKEINQYFVIREIEDKRKKPDRIRQAHSGLISEGRFHIRRSHTEYYQALYDYSDELDIDLLDAGAMAITLSSPTLLMIATNPGAEDEDGYLTMIQQQEAHYPDLPPLEGGCP